MAKGENFVGQHIKSHNGNVLRNPQAKREGRVNRANARLVITGKQRSGTVSKRKYFLRRFASALISEPAVLYPLFLKRQIVFAAVFPVGPIPQPRIAQAVAPDKMPYFSMAYFGKLIKRL